MFKSKFFWVCTLAIGLFSCKPPAFDRVPQKTINEIPQVFQGSFANSELINASSVDTIKVDIYPKMIVLLANGRRDTFYLNQQFQISVFDKQYWLSQTNPYDSTVNIFLLKAEKNHFDIQFLREENLGSLPVVKEVKSTFNQSKKVYATNEKQLLQIFEATQQDRQTLRMLRR